jgi:hypothetical protein
MGTIYWNQWDTEELSAMQGMDEEDDIDLYHGEDDIEMYHYHCNCSGCMSCLGLSWRDFR